MTITLSSTALFFFFLSLFVVVFGSQSEIASLLEFKKGIHDDPLNKIHSTWNMSSLSDPNGCPALWTGVTCDPDASSVVAINLNQMDLSGELKFYTLINLKSLQNLSLSGNLFTGRLVPTLGSMSSLQYLDLSNNKFYGPIPGRITDLWGLNYLNLSMNNFTGGFPGNFRNLQQLKALDLHRNELWGDISEIMTELKNVESVDLSFNKFYGGLAFDVENVSSVANTLRFMNLSHNRLNGKFFKGDVIGLFRNLEVLDLSDNGISGELPGFGSLTNLKVLRLGNNQLFGMIPEELFESGLPVQELDLSGNGFTGSIRGINSTTLSVLNLSSNSLSGSLPTSLKTCVVLDLSRNMISGDISVMHNWEANLEIIDLSSNNLSGNLPNLTSEFNRLSMFNLRNNSLVGPLPSLLETSPRLVTVDISLNQLNGHIPASFFASMTLTNLNLSGNGFTGPIPFQVSHVSELLVLPSYPPMESLDLSSNFLSGVLPSDIGNMGRLKLLNLANNDLSGDLPAELNKLSVLEYLDLSGNKFKGKIPDKLSSRLNEFNVSYNDLTGRIPKNLRNFPKSSFRPGNDLLIFPDDMPSTNYAQGQDSAGAKHHSSKSSIRVAIIVATVGAAVMIVFVLLVYRRTQLREFHGRTKFNGQTTGRDIKEGGFSRPSLFNFHSNVQRPPSSLSFSNDHLLTSNSRSLSGQAEFITEIIEQNEGVTDSSASMNPNLLDNHPATSGRKSSPGSPLSSSPRFIEAREPPVMLDVYSPDRLAGELFFLDASLAFSAEELSRAPAEVLGRSSHGTLYKATLDSGHMLTVKWLRVGLVKHKKEFAKEAKKIGSMRHPNIVPLRAYYWGPREQERLLLADYIRGDSLALHLYETTPRRYSPLSFSQRVKVAVDVARCLLHLHDRGLPHGNLKPTNILLAGPDYDVCLSDYGLHRLMTPAGIAEQILNLGALGYRAPELATASKPAPSFKADVYAFGVILMELLTRRSAGDIISGQSGAVDLTDWVRLCDQEGHLYGKFRLAVTSNALITPADNVLVAFSGGPSSRVALQFVHEMQQRSQKNFDASKDRSLRVFGVGVVYVDESTYYSVPSCEIDKAIQDMKLTVSDLAPPAKELHIVPIESVFSLESSDGRERLKKLLDSVSDPTGREDLLLHLRMLALQKFASENGYNRLVLGLCTSRIACHVISATVKGQGYSLSADIQYADARWEIPVVLPLRDCLAKELNMLCQLDGLKTVEFLNKPHSGINGLVSSFVKLLQQENPSRECTIVRTAGKLTPFHFNKIPELNDSSVPLASRRRQKRFNLKPSESISSESFCPLCYSPLNKSDLTSLNGQESSENSNIFGAACCSSCRFQIFPKDHSSMEHFCSLLPGPVVARAKHGDSNGNFSLLRKQIQDCLLSDSEDET